MVYKTRGIVLRSIRYGETSVVTNIFTELFGMQSYLINGVRTGKSKVSKANLLQPANILDLVVYHRDNKNLQRLSDFRYAYLYRSLYADVIKNSIALFFAELLDKTLKEPESYPELFHFTSDALEWMDGHHEGFANLPLYFMLKVSELQGFKFCGEYTTSSPFLDLSAGTFVADESLNTYTLNEKCSGLAGSLLKVKSFDSLKDIRAGKQLRRQLLSGFELFYELHLPGFSGLKSPRVLSEILE